jgi:hypothetical protein
MDNPLLSEMFQMIEFPVGDSAWAMIDEVDLPLVIKHAWYPAKGKDTSYAMFRTMGAGTVYMHRLIAGAAKGFDVDHIDGNGLNNRRNNLRVCTHAQNIANQRISRANTSGFKGVSWDKRRGAWEAHIKFQQKKRFLGYFSDKADAARAYNAKAVELFGEFASINQVA